MAHERFQRAVELDAQEQRRLLAHLEEIDAATFEANREVLARTVGRVDVRRFKRLACATAQARADWVAAALQMTERPAPPSEEDSARLAGLRAAYEELMHAYEGMRRMVERGYLCYLDRAERDEALTLVKRVG
ncbi:MAG TPA: hypothetical protein VG841_09470 [Caulobacterales bacterium]|nr:hypothetical protein [Caulobacterales bacterium]